METKYLIWSVEHGQWWMPRRNGYNIRREDAGRHWLETAIAICQDANRFRENWDSPNECMVPE
jgi:hypothetical protein